MPKINMIIFVIINIITFTILFCLHNNNQINTINNRLDTNTWTKLDTLRMQYETNVFGQMDDELKALRGYMEQLEFELLKENKSSSLK